MRLLVALILLALFFGGSALEKERKAVKAYEPPKWINDVLVTNGHKTASGEYIQKKLEVDEDLLDFESADKEVEEEKKKQEAEKQEKINERIRENWMPGDDEGRVETV